LSHHERLLGPDGSQVSQHVLTNQANAVERVLGQLVGWARWFSLHDLSNPQEGLKVEFEIRSAAASRDPGLEAKADQTLLDGEEREFSVTNRNNRDIYFAILDLTDSGKIGIVCPGEGRNEALAAGMTYKEKVPVSVPESRAQIREYLKLIAIQTDVDFRFLRQDGIKSVHRSTNDPLMQPIGKSFLVEPRDVGSSKQRLDGWSTSILILDVERDAP
jgi:hypothetical protein